VPPRSGWYRTRCIRVGCSQCIHQRHSRCSRQPRNRCNRQRRSRGRTGRRHRRRSHRPQRMRTSPRMRRMTDDGRCASIQPWSMLPALVYASSSLRSFQPSSIYSLRAASNGLPEAALLVSQVPPRRCMPQLRSAWREWQAGNAIIGQIDARGAHRRWRWDQHVNADYLVLGMDACHSSYHVRVCNHSAEQAVTLRIKYRSVRGSKGIVSLSMRWSTLRGA